MSVKPTLLELILNATAAGKSMLAAANAAAQKTLLSLVKGDVGLGNVDNTSDANKPVSTAQQTALDAKANGTNSVTGRSIGLFGTSTDVGATYRNMDIHSPTGTFPMLQLLQNSILKSQFYWTGVDTAIYSDTHLLVTSASSTPMIHVGGTTSAFPALKRSGTTTAFRLADDSADSPITCSNATLSGNLVIGSPGFSAAAPIKTRGAAGYVASFEGNTANGDALMSVSSNGTSANQILFGIDQNGSMTDYGSGGAFLWSNGNNVIIDVYSAHSLIFATNNVARLTISSAGVATLTGALSLAQKTIATLPSAAASNGQRFMVTDSAVQAGRMAYCYGSVWRYEDGSTV